MIRAGRAAGSRGRRRAKEEPGEEEGVRKGKRGSWSGRLVERQRGSDTAGGSQEEGVWEGWRGGAARCGEESANFQFKGIVGSSHGLRLAPHLSAARAATVSSGPRIPGIVAVGTRAATATMVSRAEHRGGAGPGWCALQVTPAAPGPNTRLGRGYAPSLTLGTAESHARVARLLRTVQVSPFL